MKTSVVLQGNTRHGWDTEECRTMDEVKLYLNYQRISGTYSVSVWIDGKHVHTLFKSREHTSPKAVL